eukprot:g6436.t1
MVLSFFIRRSALARQWPTASFRSSAGCFDKTTNNDVASTQSKKSDPFGGIASSGRGTDPENYVGSLKYLKNMNKASRSGGVGGENTSSALSTEERDLKMPHGSWTEEGIPEPMHKFYWKTMTGQAEDTRNAFSDIDWSQRFESPVDLDVDPLEEPAYQEHFMLPKDGEDVGDGVDWDSEEWLNKYGDKELDPQQFMEEAGFVVWNMHSWVVRNMTAKGKTMSYKAMVVVGNRMGTGGFGIGKADNVQKAYDRAIWEARKDLIHLDLHEGPNGEQTIIEPLVGKHNSTKCLMWPSVKAGGMNVPKPVFAVADCFGITDLRAKLVGRQNKTSQMRAIFNCFKGIRSLEDIARGRGRRVYEVKNICPSYVRNL